MLDLLINHSIHLIGIVVLGLMAHYQYKRLLQQSGLTPEAFRSSLRVKFNEVGNKLAAKLATSLVVATIISIVSFRELFVNDVFHTVFFTMVLVPLVYKKVKYIFE